MFSHRFTRLKNPSSWRRLAIAFWNPPNDPTLQGHLSIDFTQGLSFLEEINKRAPVQITLTHLVAKATALTLRQFPDLNAIIRWKQIYLRKSVDIFVRVVIESTNENPDLSGTKIENCDVKDLMELAKELKEKSVLIQQKKDPQFKSVLLLLRLIPDFILSWVIRFMSFLVYNLDLKLPSLGLYEDPFGSAMVTSLMSLKGPTFFSALDPITRVPLLVCVGGLEVKPVFVEGQVVGRPILQVTVTADHRIIDGLQGIRVTNSLQKILENPQKYLMQT